MGVGRRQVERDPGPPQVLAAIVNYNGAELTDRSVTSFREMDGAEMARLIVLDAASRPDGLLDLVARVGRRAEIVALPRNGGYAAACNHAARLAFDAGARYAWFLNNDLLFEPQTLRTLLQTLERNPGLAAVAPATIAMGRSHTVLGAGVDVDLRRGRVRHRNAQRPTSELPMDPYVVEGLEGACLLVRTEALRAIGPMDEGFFMYWEDTEWSVRARRMGYQLAIVPNGRVQHAVASSSDPLSRTELMIRNRVRFVRATGSRLDQAVFLAYFLVAWLPAYYVARLVPRFGPRAATRLVGRALAWNVADARKRGRWRLQPPTRWPERPPSGDTPPSRERT